MKQSYTRALTYTSFFSLCALGVLLGVDVTLAADAPKYTPLVGIPGLTDSGTKTLPEYINAVYILIITIGALFGVIKIAFAGVKYSMSDVVTDKGEAKKDIYNVLLGLGVLLIPFMVLNTINPNLTKLDVLQEAQKINLNTSLKNGAGSPTATKTSGPSRETVVNSAKATCEATTGNVWQVIPPDSGRCSSPTRVTNDYPYRSSTERDVNIQRCTNSGGTPVDQPSSLTITGGIIKCNTTSKVGQIPI